MVEVGDHYRPARDESDRSPANDGNGDGPVYRVVGTTDDVALLRVTDADGRRAHTGDLRRVAHEEFDAEFEPAGDPDAGPTPVADARNLLSGLYWSVRRFF